MKAVQLPEERAAQDPVQEATPERGLQHRQQSLTLTLWRSTFWQERAMIMFVFYKSFSATVDRGPRGMGVSPCYYNCPGKRSEMKSK